MGIQTEFEFTLPKGYVDENGSLHRNGIMRLATAADEILPLRDPRVRQNPAYITIIILSRVISKLGNLNTINTRIVEGLFASDLAYLQSVYNKINGQGTTNFKGVCPTSKSEFKIDKEDQGE
jgi:hypothetical protein